jgi:hypothetical protein
MTTQIKIRKTKKQLEETIRQYQYYITEAIAESKGPLCASYEYDPTPTAEERLRNIRKILEQALKA